MKVIESNKSLNAFVTALDECQPKMRSALCRDIDRGKRLTLDNAMVAESLAKQLDSKKDYDHSLPIDQDDLKILEKKPYILASRRYQMAPL